MFPFKSANLNEWPHWRLRICTLLWRRGSFPLIDWPFMRTTMQISAHRADTWRQRCRQLVAHHSQVRAPGSHPPAPLIIERLALVTSKFQFVTAKTILTCLPLWVTSKEKWKIATDENSEWQHLVRSISVSTELAIDLHSIFSPRFSPRCHINHKGPAVVADCQVGPSLALIPIPWPMLGAVGHNTHWQSLFLSSLFCCQLVDISIKPYLHSLSLPLWQCHKLN